MLEAIGPKVFHVGPNGAAVTMKIAINLSPRGADARLQRGRAARGEERHPARAGGRGDARQRDRLADGRVPRPASCSSSRTRPGSTCHMMQKDLNLALELGRRARRPAADDGRHERAAHRRERGLGLGDGTSPSSSTCSRAMSGVQTSAVSAASSARDRRRARSSRCTGGWSRSGSSRSRSTTSTARAKMPGLAHLYIGEEAVAVGVCSALRRDDYITSTHRGHGHCLAKGADVALMFAELLGQGGRLLPGKGGSMHIADHANGNLGANAIVGGSTGIATGAAFSAKRRGTDQVAVCFFGDGALGQGLLYEVMNMASLWTLPVIYVCENNLYNEYTHYLEATAGDDPRPSAVVRNRGGRGRRPGRARGLRRDRRARRARARAATGRRFLLCNTYRYHGHHVGDVDRALLPLEGRGGALAHASAIRSRCTASWLRRAGARRRGGARRRFRRTERGRGRAGRRRSRSTTPFPDPSEVTEDVFA